MPYFQVWFSLSLWIKDTSIYLRLKHHGLNKWATFWVHLPTQFLAGNSSCLGNIFLCFCPMYRIDNKPTSAQLMGGCRPGYKQLPETILTTYYDGWTGFWATIRGLLKMFSTNWLQIGINGYSVERIRSEYISKVTSSHTLSHARDDLCQYESNPSRKRMPSGEHGKMCNIYFTKLWPKLIEEMIQSHASDQLCYVWKNSFRVADVVEQIGNVCKCNILAVYIVNSWPAEWPFRRGSYYEYIAGDKKYSR